MKKYVLLLSYFLISLQLKAQESKKERSPFDFKVSKNASFPIKVHSEKSIEITQIKRYNQQLDSTFKIDKNYAFEFRLWKTHLQSNFDNVSILTLKENNWTARYFNMVNRTFTEKKIDQSKAVQLWILLNQHHILTTPAKHNIDKNLTIYQIDTTTFNNSRKALTLTDGVLYSFELKSTNGKRRYDYGNPNYYFRQFPNVEELADVVTAIMLIQKFLGEPINVY